MPASFDYQPLASVNPLAIIPATRPYQVPIDMVPRFDVSKGIENAFRVEDQTRASRAAKDADRLRTATVRALPPGATAFDTGDIEEYRQRWGALPMDPATGQIDINAVRARLSAQKEIETGLQTDALLTARAWAESAACSSPTRP